MDLGRHAPGQQSGSTRKLFPHPRPIPALLGPSSLRTGSGSVGGAVPGHGTTRNHAGAPRESGACWECSVSGCAWGVRGSPVLPGPNRKSGHQNGSSNRGCPFPKPLPSLLETTPLASLAARCHHVAEFWRGRSGEPRAQ